MNNDLVNVMRWIQMRNQTNEEEKKINIRIELISINYRRDYGDENIRILDLIDKFNSNEINELEVCEKVFRRIRGLE